jgi:uncharacterized repeat protein (TIGR03803 family)
MNAIRKHQVFCVAFLFCFAAAVAAPAQTFTNLATFDITNGTFPSGLTQGLDGNFYGTTNGGGTGGVGAYGTVFSVTPSGTITPVHKFGKTGGAYPVAALLLAANGDLYGTTTNPATLFSVAPGGTFSTVSSVFVPTDSALIQSNLNGLFYGAAQDALSYNELFSSTAAGTVSTLYGFCKIAGCRDGSNPVAPLTQANNGFFYGTTENGGKGTEAFCTGTNPSCGTIFRIGAGGNITILHSFDWTDGAYPQSSLIQASDGNLYGTTRTGGGGSGPGCPFGCGSVFKISLTGTFSPVFSFDDTDGVSPSTLVQGTDGNFYGTTPGTGSKGTCSGTDCGTIFQLTPAGVLTTLHSFDGSDGINPLSGVVQGTDGNFYGTTYGFDGVHLYGTVFKLSMGLAPFVITNPIAANPGTTIIILGSDLTGATSVKFNGTSATFTVVSATEITATVPAGSSTGTVVVDTPGGTLSSNVQFKVF